LAILELQKITKHFGGLIAVNEVDMTVPEDRVLGLIGPNGAGKTTLFNLIVGYFAPDKGRIIFNGRDITGLKSYEVCKRGLARTFQTTKPFLESTVIDNVMIGALLRDANVKIAKKISLEIIEMLELGPVSLFFGHELTIPDRKRLEIARALATGCKLLLLDEPMAGLNPVEKAHMVNLLKRINGEGISMIVVEHDMKSVMSLCSFIVLLDRGQKLVEGTPKEVTKDPRAIAAYLGEDYGNIRN
jgi:branched-chain amino acid transport system ATP-binding protein